MAPTSRSNQPPGPGGTSSGAGGISGGASVEVSASDRPGGRGIPPPPPGPGAQQQHPQKPEQQVQYYLTEPLVVYDFGKKRKKRKKKYSRGLRTVQRAEDGLTLAGRRLGDAVESGFKSYRKRRNKSANKKKDGALRDIFPNSARGLSRFLEVGSDAPYDVARRVNSKRFGKQVRNTVRFFTAPFGIS